MDIGSTILSLVFTIFLILLFTYFILKLTIWIIAYVKDIKYEIDSKYAELQAKKEYIAREKNRKKNIKDKSTV